MDQGDQPLALPELHEGVLSADQFAAYGADLKALASDIRCQVRRQSPGGRGAPQSPDRVGIDEAMERARAGAAVQIQYDYAGARWRDTLMATVEGHRLIRMRLLQEKP